MNYKATERVTEYVNGLDALKALETNYAMVSRIQLPIEVRQYKALNAEYAMICTESIPKIKCKAGDMILFTKNITEKTLYHNGVYVCAKPGDIATQLGFITWHELSYTFKPFSNDPPVKCSYTKPKFKILACATGFIRTL